MHWVYAYTYKIDNPPAQGWTFSPCALVGSQAGYLEETPNAFYTSSYVYRITFDGIAAADEYHAPE